MWISSKTNNDFNEHNDLKHKSLNEVKQESNEIKLEVFALVFTDNVLETRKNIMEKLNEQDEVEDVEKAFISKVESYSDVDSLFWNKADIPLKSKRDIK